MNSIRAQAWIVAILLGSGTYLLLSHNSTRRIAGGLVVAGIVGCVVLFINMARAIAEQQKRSDEKLAAMAKQFEREKRSP